MTVVTPLALRWERARHIDRGAIQVLGNGWYYVPSQHGPAGYAAQIEFDRRGNLVAATCTCPDYQKRVEGPGAPALRGVRVCKHILAACLRADELGLRLAKQEPGNASQAHPRLTSPAKQPVTATTVPQGQPAVNLFPTANEPVWDDIACEWVLTDSDGIRYWGNTPGECYRQFHEALHYLAVNAQRGGFSVVELREFRAQQHDYAAQRIDERPY